MQMVLYDIDPNLKLKTVTTHDGKQEYLKNCKLVNTNYYLVSDCIQVQGELQYKNNPSILLDHETGENFMKEKKGKRFYGIISIENDALPVCGYFTANICKNVKFIDQSRNLTMAISGDIFKNKKKYIENLSEGIWYYHEDVTKETLRQHQKIINIYDWTAKKYNIEDNEREFSLKKNVYQNYPHNISKENKKFGKFLNYSWGVEFEVYAGFVPDHQQYRNGVVVCRDGSIQGGEYVTVPMQGPKGLAALQDLCTDAKKRVILDINCSMHLHLGNFPVSNKKMLCALYILCLKIQEHVFDMLPPYKRYWEGFKRKNYCRHLETMGIQVFKDEPGKDVTQNIQKIFENIFSFISDFRREYHDHREGNQHPSGAKWDIENRKTWVNFVNTMYTGRKTLEFRAHQATFNEVKTINWLFICSAILDYAVINADRLVTEDFSISLEDVLNVFKDANKDNKDAEFLSDYLNAYVKTRTEQFTRAFKGKDFACAWDLREDQNYNFKLNEKNLLIS